MFSFSKTSTHLQPSLFDIRIRSANKNVLFLEGQAGESNTLAVFGHVVFSIPEDITVRSISLHLSGCFRLDFLESFQDNSGKVIAACPVRKEMSIVQCEWGNLLTSSEGVVLKSGLSGAEHTNSLAIKQQNSGKYLTSRAKPTKLTVNEKIPTGTTPFPNKQSSNGNIMFTLPRGNYSLPFKAALPGNIPETVEGLRCGVVLYRLASKMNGAKPFKKDPQTWKYLRIFRKPLQTEVAMCEDCSVESTWPGKIQYEVRLPRKALPLGGKAKMHILIVPLMKGLELGKITVSIQQYFSLKGDGDESFEDEHTVFKCVLPKISMDELSPDKWSLEARISLPLNLKQCTPDVDLKDDLIRVRHKLTLNINIINSDGHISQVKSKLPIILYISGRDKVMGRNVYVDRTGRIRFKTGTCALFENSKDQPRFVSALEPFVAPLNGQAIPQTIEEQIEDDAESEHGHAEDDSDEQNQNTPTSLLNPPSSENKGTAVREGSSNLFSQAPLEIHTMPSSPLLSSTGTTPIRIPHMSQIGRSRSHGITHTKSHGHNYKKHSVDGKDGTEEIQEIRVDPGYDFGRDFSPDSSDESESSESFLPSYNDSKRDVHLDPSMISPISSPIPISDAQLGSSSSYFDLDPQILHRATSRSSSFLESPAAQFLSSATSAAATPTFDESMNEVPSYSSVYDDDYSVTTDPAPPYEEAVGKKSDEDFGDYLVRKVEQERSSFRNRINKSCSTGNSGVSTPPKAASHRTLASGLQAMPPLRKTLSSTIYRPRVSMPALLARNFSSENVIKPRSGQSGKSMKESYAPKISSKAITKEVVSPDTVTQPASQYFESLLKPTFKLRLPHHKN